MPVPDARWCTAAGFALASLIALSRVYLGAHFPTDVLAGALLGAVVGAYGGARYVSRAKEANVRGLVR